MMTTVKKKIFNKVDEKKVLIAIIGTLEAIKNDGITIEEGEKNIFSPYMAGKLKERHCDEKIIELIMKGCELEDINSLIPQKLVEEIDEMKQEAFILLRNYAEYNTEFWFEE